MSMDFLESPDFRKYCRQNGIAMLGMFGSAARGEATPDSDIDLLVRFSKGKSLLTLVRMERELTQKIGRKVDLVTVSAVSPYLRESIQADLRVLYES